MVDVQIRPATPSDRDRLARLREALWPETPAADHARELEPILAGETPGSMPLVNFVAEFASVTVTGSPAIWTTTVIGLLDKLAGRTSDAEAGALSK